MSAPARALLLLPILCLTLAAAPASAAAPPVPAAAAARAVLAAPRAQAAPEDASSRGAAAWGRQDFVAAAEAYAEVVAENERDLQAWFRLGYALHAQGRYAEAAAASERAAQPGAPTAASAGYNAACAHALAGDRDAALRLLDRAVTLGFADRRLLASDSDLDTLRADPRFADVWSRVVSAAAPDAATLAARRREFDPWLGEWDGLPRVLDPQGKFVDGGWLAVKVVPALEGHAVLEYSEGSIAPGTGLTTVGYSLRAVDPGTGTWELVLNWPSPNASTFGRLSGGWRHHRGEFFTQTQPNPQGGAFARFTFSDVAPDHMRWDSARTTDGGKTWLPDLIFEKTRRGPDAEPLWDGASRNHAWGNAPEYRALDFALGTWRGTRTAADGATHAVERRLRSILEGALVEHFTRVDDREHAYEIAGWVGGKSTWESHALLREDTTLRVASGAVDGDTVSFTAAWKDPSHPEQRTRLAREGDTLSVVRELRDAEGAWATEWTEELELVAPR